jgi:hypothetical protein
MFKWIHNLTKSYQVSENYELLVTDNDGNKHSLVDLCSLLAKEVLKLEERIAKLEQENVELTNSLYEVENRLQAQIDKIHPVTYNLSNYSLDK